MSERSISENDVLLRAHSLVKRFGDFTAVDNVDIEVKKGEIYGFLGPNGAGKTTTIRMLSTLLKPTSGELSIDGYSIPKDIKKARDLIGIAQQHNGLDRDITSLENIQHHAILHKMPRSEYEPKMRELIDMFGLEPYLNKLTSDLSGGWKKKVAIVGSIIHSPKILFLDEPTTGLDIKSRILLWDIIKKLNEMGTTIFLTTHYIEEAEALCDRISIIDGGKIVKTGVPSELCMELGKWTIEESDEDGRRLTYFSEMDKARNHLLTLDPSESAFMRETRLEDVYLRYTDREEDEQ